MLCNTIKRLSYKPKLLKNSFVTLAACEGLYWASIISSIKTADGYNLLFIKYIINPKAPKNELKNKGK